MSTLYDITAKNTINASHLRIALTTRRAELIRLQAAYPSTFKCSDVIKELDEVLLFIDMAKTVRLEIIDS
jgi:hypothetical protein